MPCILSTQWNKLVLFALYCNVLLFLIYLLSLYFQPWVFIGRTDVEAEAPKLWPHDAKSWLIWKDPDAGKDWGQEEKGMTEDKMVGWRHWLNGHGFGWTPGVGDGQGGLACCDSWARKELDTTERLNWLTDWSLLTVSFAKNKSSKFQSLSLFCAFLKFCINKFVIMTLN